jgi:hypothetical protein
MSLYDQSHIIVDDFGHKSSDCRYLHLETILLVGVER